jgi:hypothetical protein
MHVVRSAAGLARREPMHADIASVAREGKCPVTIETIVSPMVNFFLLSRAIDASLSQRRSRYTGMNLS